MNNQSELINQIFENVSEEKLDAFKKLHTVITENLPDGFEVGISYGFLGYVVPHSIYPKGYHCKANEPLPFLSIAAQKASINLYHMGLYADEKLYNWFVQEYPKHSKYKLDIGKSCIRFKKLDHIPYELIAELVKKMSVSEWINLYESKFNK